MRNRPPQPPLAAALLVCLLGGLCAAPAVADIESVALPAPVAEAPAEEAATGPVLSERIEPQRWLVLPRVGRYKRAALHVDPVEARVARGEWASPEPGDTLAGATWREAAEGRSADLAGGYAYAEFDAPVEGVYLLEAPGCAAVCLNGEWLPGDPYGAGWFRPPTRVRAGKNWLLAHLARPNATPRLVLPGAAVALLAEQATLPDVVSDGAEDLVASLPLVNASDDTIESAVVQVRWGESEPQATPLRPIAARLITPVTLRLPAPPEGLEVGQTARLVVEVLAPPDDVPDDAAEGAPEGEDAPVETIARAELTLRVVGADEPRTNTFLSAIDGSVQPYAVRPAKPSEGARPTGVLLALHDAGQTANACRDGLPEFAGAHVVAPHGRGRWGFDWEDWSRLDALEALDDFQKRQAERRAPIDPDRVAVWGRGMGGHGALRLATLHPGRFAAVGIVDGWISFYTQGGAVALPTGARPLERVLARQASANDPLRVLENLAGVGASVLATPEAGVGPTESRYLRERLGEFHNDFAYHEPTDKALVKDALRTQLAWLAERRRRDHAGADQIDFATPDVGASATLGWATILGVQRQGDLARVRLSRDPVSGEVTGATDNVRRLRLTLGDWRGPEAEGEVRVRLDGGRGVKLDPRRDGDSIALARDDQGVWRRVPDVGRRRGRRFGGLFKGPERSGGLKNAFCCRPLLVYGTRGTEDERRWAAAKARYDAHLFLYRGAGRLEVWSDRQFAARLRRPGRAEPGRSVVLYGNGDTNTGWALVRQEAFLRRREALSVEAGEAAFGPRPEAGDDLALLAVRPRVGDERSCVAVIGGTGPVGMRMTSRLRYFWSGVEYPDFLLFGPEALAPPPEAAPVDDVRAAGWFDSDWGVDADGVAWRDLAL